MKDMDLKREEDRIAYNNYIRVLDRASYYRSNIYNTLLEELEDVGFLKLQLGVFYKKWILEIEKRLPEFENIMKKEFNEDNSLDEIDKKIALDYKSELKLRVNELLGNNLKAKSIYKAMTLKDFFVADTKSCLINSVKDNFKEFKGKKMAILIYLLNKKHKILLIDNNERKSKSTLHFVRALKNDKNIQNISSTNRYLQSITGELKDVNDEDISLQTIKKQLNKIVSSC